MQQKGRKIKALENKPDDVPFDLSVYSEGFALLSSCRSVSSAGANPIQLTEIMSWLELEGINDYDEKTLAVSYIKEMDNVFLAYLRRKSDVNSNRRDRQPRSAKRK